MTTNQPLTPEEIASLVSRLGETGKGYPLKLHAARRSAFLQQAAGLQISPQVLSGKVFKNPHANIPKHIQTTATSTLQVATQWLLGIMASVLFVAAAIIAADAVMEPVTSDNDGAVPFEIASMPDSSKPFQISPFLTPTPYYFTPTYLPAGSLTRLPRKATPSATPSADYLKVSDNEDSGKHLGQTPTPPAFRFTPKPDNPDKTPRP